ncbi:hypothetical protein HYU16_04675 [Candidatus Woesearchaeota archaeon]|nr:hypothetical protein [Candidatus Woesearchaeota archaeon]
MIITIDTERSNPEEIRKAVKILVSLEESTWEIRGVIRMLYDVLAAKVNEERRRYREIIRKHARTSPNRNKGARQGAERGVARSGGMFQGVEIG